MDNKIISIFTPTYNRAYTLPKLYKSLCNQNSKKFIWIVIDDGSTDNTNKLIATWLNEKIIDIKYIYQKNMGKQRAINTGIDNCKTELFAFIDSDDYYTDNALNNIIKVYKKIKFREDVAGIMGRVADSKMIKIGKKLPKKELIDHYDNLVKKYNYDGDTCRIYKTKILKKFKFPIIDDKFIPEVVMFGNIDRHYKLYIVDEIFTIVKYLEDGLTRNKKIIIKENPTGYRLSLEQLIISKRGFTKNYKTTLLYIIWCKKFNLEKSFLKCTSKVMFILAYLPALILYLFKKPRWVFFQIG